MLVLRLDKVKLITKTLSKIFAADNIFVIFVMSLRQAFYA